MKGSSYEGHHRTGGARRGRWVVALLALSLFAVQTQFVFAGNDKNDKKAEAPRTEQEIKKECRERAQAEYGQNAQWRAQNCDDQPQQTGNGGGGGNGNGNGNGKGGAKSESDSGGGNSGGGNSGGGNSGGGNSGGGNSGGGNSGGGNSGGGNSGGGNSGDPGGEKPSGGKGSDDETDDIGGESAGSTEETVLDLSLSKLSGDLGGGFASLLEVDPILGNQYVVYYFVFSDGYVAQGTCVTLDCVIHPDAGGQATHLSCSDSFAGGFSDQGGFPQPGDPSIVTYFIQRYKWSNPLDDYVLFKTCGAQPAAPTLNVEKTAANGTINAGAQASFTITVTNNGPGIATAVTLNDPLPPGLTWTDNSGSCAIEAGTLSCTIGDMAENATFSVTVTATTDASDCGLLENVATADGTNTDPAVGGADITVVCIPVLSIVKTPDGGTISAGMNAVFTITVTNNGPGIATAVTLNDTLPGDMTWTDNSDSCTVTGGNALSCTFGDLAQGASASVTLTAPTDASDCGLLDNQDATADASNAAPVTDDGDITVDCGVTVDLDKTNDADGDGTFTDSEIAPSEGSDVPFQLTITNTSTVPVIITTLTDAFGGGIPTTVACLSGGQNVIGMTLAASGDAGDSVTCTFTLTNYAPPGGQVLVNTARVVVAEVGDLDDTDEDTDTSTVTTLSPEISVDVQKTNDADEDGTFTDSEEALEEGASVTFQAVVTNTSTIPVVLTALTDEFPGTGAFAICADLIGTTLQPGAFVTCTFSLTGYAPPANGSITDIVRTTVVDAQDDTRTASDFDDSTVTTPEVLPEIIRRPRGRELAQPTGLLALTGGSFAWLGALALLLLTAGLVLAMAGRRRRGAGSA